ncbi:hypothetical protein [Leisingera caerulea]|uniref:hypothetical protein n=1 Tax=Leisingera caerulea TaxID=506591 RepID=UPI0021A8BA7B|nr:hypothetical protein [Leisingera caerulea]UWQ82931.1 hypothetical protein K3726_14815 [Leisingera caerulea]
MIKIGTLPAGVILALGIAAGVLAAPLDIKLKRLSSEKDWVANQITMGNRQSCIAHTVNDGRAWVFGIGFEIEQGPYVLAKLPWPETLPGHGPFLIEVGEHIYQFRGEASTDIRPAGTEFEMPIRDPKLLAQFLRDVAAGNHVTVRGLTANHVYSLAGSNAAIDAFNKCVAILNLQTGN